MKKVAGVGILVVIGIVSFVSLAKRVPTEIKVQAENAVSPGAQVERRQMETASLASLEALMKDYSVWSDMRLSESLKQVETQIEKEKWIEKANHRVFSPEEENQFRGLLRKVHAIRLVRAERALE